MDRKFAQNPNQQKKDISQDDILDAMTKLTKMIEVDKRNLGLETTAPTYDDSSPERGFKSKAYDSEDDAKAHDIDYLNEPELIENVKAAAKEISDLINRSNNLSKSTHMMMIPRDTMHVSRRDHSGGRSQRGVHRLYELDVRKKEKLAAMQFQKYKDELSTLQSKPEISLTSKLIAKYKASQPIYARAQEVLNQKEENLKKIKMRVEEDRKEREPALTFKPNIKKKQGFEKNRTIKEFATQVYAWQSKKNETIQRQQYETITKELESLTFKPLINSTSKKIAQKTSEKQRKVEDRLLQKKEEMDEKKKRVQEKTQPRFKPYITEKSQHMARNKSPLYEAPWKSRSKSPMNKSYIDLDALRRNAQNDSFVEHRSNRSVTPTPERKYRIDPSSGNKLVNTFEKKSYNPPKINEVEYTPAIDFLLKKVT